MRKQAGILVFIATLFAAGAVGAKTTHRAEPTAILSAWGYPRQIDEQGRVWHTVAPQELWGVTLPVGMMCRNDQTGAPPVPCEALALPKVRDVLLAHSGKWLTIMT